MRAPVQKTRPRRTGKQTAPEGGASSESAGKGRAAHVRNRLIIAVAVVAAAVAGAGAPSVVAASGQLNDSQSLVTLVGQTQQALTLAHSLADERDEVTSYVAAGRPKSKAPAEQQSARVDRQVEELRADPDAPTALRKDLDAVDAVRRAALTGKSTALEAHQAYSATITELHALAEELAEQLPPRAGSGAHALAELDGAVQQSAAARGLLLAALNIPRSTRTTINPATGLPTISEGSSAADTKQRDALTAAAQQAAVRSDAAIADFRDTAPQAARASYDSTVNGPEVASAEEYLAGLTDQPTLSDSELGTSVKKLDAALSARVELMRGVESSLYEHRSKDLVQLRDDDVTALEIRVALLGALILVALGIATAMARTLTRPLSVLRRGSARLAADPATEEPVKFTGRNDEFAQVVRSVNALHAHAVALHERQTTLEADRKHLIGQRQTMADDREQLRAEIATATAHLEQVRQSIHGTFVNLALRTLGLVERQLAVIEGLEEREQDADRLATLFKLDHFATVMRRHSENLLVLAGAEHVQQHAGPVPLVDIVRAAVSEIERYERVRIAALPPHAHLAGFAADDLSHLIAELLENATSFSPPDVPVEVSGWLLENGEVMLSVQDEGIGMTTERMRQLNSRLADFDPEDAYDQESGEGLGLGLYVVARLAHRLGVRVQLREQKQGGVAAVVVLPGTLLASAPEAVVSTTGPLAGGAASLSLPGADAEANSNVLYARSTVAVPDATVTEPDSTDSPDSPAVVPEPAADEDPLIAAAERAVRESDEDAVTGESAVREPEPEPEQAHEPTSPETTMELLAPVPAAEEPAPAVELPAQTATDPFAVGPDAHERTVDEGEEPPAAEEPGTPRLTAKGLPKRTPRISAPDPAPRRRAGGVDAEALRRRLGGFHQGARSGQRVVEAENAEKTAETKAPTDRPTDRPADRPTREHTAPHGTAQDVEASGGTVEEASS
ncbi:nitrate- and nitrite sensing domain-containing protein [Streptomyces avermitilis]|uniref:sensor histidine kinase n=1 Tax=Streptomyces avermitilis TaxID=33903 RepID=UPI0033A0E7EF